MARALPGVLPEMSIEESLDVTRTYWVAHQLPAGTPLIRYHPFRAPHDTICRFGGWWEYSEARGDLVSAQRCVIFG